MKVEKQYKYWDIILSNILKRYANDDKSTARHVQVSATNPQSLAPTKTVRKTPTTKDLVEPKLSRFKSKKWLYCILDTENLHMLPVLGMAFCTFLLSHQY